LEGSGRNGGVEVAEMFGFYCRQAGSWRRGTVAIDVFELGAAQLPSNMLECEGVYCSPKSATTKHSGGSRQAIAAIRIVERFFADSEQRRFDFVGHWPRRRPDGRPARIRSDGWWSARSAARACADGLLRKYWGWKRRVIRRLARVRRTNWFHA